jgi:hypothetical protein
MTLIIAPVVYIQAKIGGHDDELLSSLQSLRGKGSDISGEMYEIKVIFRALLQKFIQVPCNIFRSVSLLNSLSLFSHTHTHMYIFQSADLQCGVSYCHCVAF